MKGLKKRMKKFSRKNSQLWKNQDGGQFIPFTGEASAWYNADGTGALRRDDVLKISLDLNGSECEMTKFVASDDSNPVDELRKGYDCARFPKGVSSDIDLSEYVNLFEVDENEDRYITLTDCEGQ